MYRKNILLQILYIFTAVQTSHKLSVFSSRIIPNCNGVNSNGQLEKNMSGMFWDRLDGVVLPVVAQLPLNVVKVVLGLGWLA